MQLIFGSEFTGAGNILRWLSISIFGICIGMVFGHINLAINRQRQALWIYGSNAILSVIGYFIFIPRYGVYGAVGVTIFSEFYAGLLLLALARHYSRINLRLLTFLKIIFASALMGTLIFFLPQLPVLARVGIGIIGYVVFVILFKIISLDTIKSLLTKSPVVIKPENEV